MKVETIGMRDFVRVAEAVIAWLRLKLDIRIGGLLSLVVFILVFEKFILKLIARGCRKVIRILRASASIELRVRCSWIAIGMS